MANDSPILLTEQEVKEDATTSTFDSNWKRFMKKALAETELQERFTAHDLRAKAGSDADDLAMAQLLLGHSSPEITRFPPGFNFYIR